MGEKLLPSELYHKPLDRILNFHRNVPNAIRSRTHIQIEVGFVKPALACTIVVDNVADLFSCARSLHDPVMTVKWRVKAEISGKITSRLHVKAESNPYIKYDGNLCLNRWYIWALYVTRLWIPANSISSRFAASQALVQK